MPLTPPTSSLPPLKQLASLSLKQVAGVVDNLRSIYCPPALSALPKPKALPKHLVHDMSVPDPDDDEDAPFDVDVLRADSFEREFAIRWLTSFAARSDMWAYAPECSEAESEARAAVVDAATSILSSFAGDDEEEELTRTFTFPTRHVHRNSASEVAIHIELNDAPLLSDDHTSVGLQSWGSSIRLAERMALDPVVYGLAPDGPLRLLELGAGTGLLSIAAAKLLHLSDTPSTIVATDYHPSVLDNLRRNVATNFPSSTACPMEVRLLDWQHPAYTAPSTLPSTSFSPQTSSTIRITPYGSRCGMFWLIVPLRPTGRHEGMSNTVDAVFAHTPDAKGGDSVLAILSIEEMRKQDGIGRADEGGYKLYRIGWL
ncbi:uncharacterized protein BXZ73DRAFT_106544 [Epithele typhae]|uniref:uncharacterized protein n=1 Tax=Epithele typhae TaxID=378194 RepID=UPI0020080922|nr:uncharacterized protein BXZ73DRAFT_106544 [Epithele typhae]KAH9914649.1 hypothetical protein BXZ73DRAFT_106544 [Epithele typhae]